MGKTSMSFESSIGKRTSLFLKIVYKFFNLMLKVNPQFKDMVTKLIAEDGEIGDSPNILRNLIEFNDCTIREIMIPRSEIYAIDLNEKKDNFIKKFTKGCHSRIPVYENNLDSIVGFVHIRDLLTNLDKKTDPRKMIHSVIFVPPSMKAINLFMKMKLTRVHIAIVIDEYGGTEGLVTMADIVEEIVGEIDDEHDLPTVPDFVFLSEKVIDVFARSLLKSLEEALGVKLRSVEEEDCLTIGGLVLVLAGRIPHVGETLLHENGIAFTIKEADERSIHRIIMDMSGYNQANGT